MKHLFEVLVDQRTKSKAQRKLDALQWYRLKWLPPKPSAELAFAVYRLIIPQARAARRARPAGSASAAQPDSALRGADGAARARRVA